MATSRDSSARSFLKKAGKYAGRAHEKVRPGAVHIDHLAHAPGDAHGARCCLIRHIAEERVYVPVGRGWTLLYVYVL